MKNSALISLFSLAILGNIHAGVNVDGGTLAKKGEFPAVVKIMTYDHKFLMEFPDSLCTGTLIAPNVVLTAAHCVNENAAKKQRVSLVGDEKGLTDAVPAGGIRVTKSYFSRDYHQYYQQSEKINALINHKSFELESEEVKTKVIEYYLAALELSVAHDLALIELKTPQVISKSQLPKLGCKRLRTGTDVMVAGYGKKIDVITGTNLNHSFVLNHGNNKTIEPLFNDLNYHIEEKTGYVLSNSGDSGGPLFKKNVQSVVYGVASLAIMGKKNRASVNFYSSVSSKVAKEFFRSLMIDPSVSQDIKDVINDCL